MPVAGPIAPTRRAYAELLAEARARTLLLVGPLTAEQMVRHPPDGSRSVFSHLRSITRFEATWLLEESLEPELQSYDDWFDWMTELRQRVVQQLEAADFTASSAITERYRMNTSAVRPSCKPSSFWPSPMLRLSGGYCRAGDVSPIPDSWRAFPVVR